MLSRWFLDRSVGVGVFVTGLSQISSFFSSSIIFKEWAVLSLIEVIGTFIFLKSDFL